jgi:Fic family protein
MKHADLFHGLDEDLKQSLIKQLRNLWTHTSTAIEGNTLSLGETAFVLEEGLTVSGKPLKDHEEVVGHARAIDLIWDYIARNNGFTREDLFALHKAVQTQQVIDIYKPVGHWKVEPNGTTAVTDDEQQVFLEYAAPDAVPALMEAWFQLFNQFNEEKSDSQQALTAYTQIHLSFVRIHPFFDGNGRVARLVANMPVIKSGFPPIIIPLEKRREYIRLLSKYELAVGQAQVGEPLLPKKELITDFMEFCEVSWKASRHLIENARAQQARRNQMNS